MVGAVVTLVAVGRLQAVTPGWWGVWQENIRVFTGSSIGRADPSNPQFHEMMHLETLARGVLPAGLERYTVAVATALPASVFLLVMGRLVWLRRGRPVTPGQQRGLMALAACLTLITGYHRSYDATLLLIAMVWLAYAWTWRTGWMGRGLATAAAALFLLPTPSLLVSLARRGWLPGGLHEHPLWQSTALQAHAWAAVAWAAVLVVELWRRPRATGSPSGPAPSPVEDAAGAGRASETLQMV